MANNKVNQTARFLDWIHRYPGWWYLICTPGDKHMKPGMMQSLIKRLAQEGFYEMIFVLLTVHREARFVDEFLKFVLLDNLAELWQQDHEKLIHKLIAHLE